MRYRIIIFDFDYTLADATAGIVESINFALEKIGAPKKDEESIKKTVGHSIPDTLAMLAGETAATSAKEFAEHFKIKADQVMTASTVLFPDTVSTLRKLRDLGLSIAIVTSKPHHRIVETLRKFGIVDLVDAIIGVDDVGRAKPSPEGIEKAAALFSVNKSTVLFVGDSLVDAVTAKNAGVDFAAVTTGTTTAEELAAYPHVFIAQTLSELCGVLGV